MKLAIIFGGSGYIGTNLIEVLIRNTIFDKILVCDIKQLDSVSLNLAENVEFKLIDVRYPIYEIRCLM